MSARNSGGAPSLARVAEDAPESDGGAALKTTLSSHGIGGGASGIGAGVGLGGAVASSPMMAAPSLGGARTMGHSRMKRSPYLSSLATSSRYTPSNSGAAAAGGLKKSSLGAAPAGPTAAERFTLVRRPKTETDAEGENAADGKHVGSSETTTTTTTTTKTTMTTTTRSVSFHESVSAQADPSDKAGNESFPLAGPAASTPQQRMHASFPLPGTQGMTGMGSLGGGSRGTLDDAALLEEQRRKQNLSQNAGWDFGDGGNASQITAARSLVNLRLKRYHPSTPVLIGGSGPGHSTNWGYRSGAKSVGAGLMGLNRINSSGGGSVTGGNAQNWGGVRAGGSMGGSLFGAKATILPMGGGDEAPITPTKEPRSDPNTPVMAGMKTPVSDNTSGAVPLAAGAGKVPGAGVVPGAVMGLTPGAAGIVPGTPGAAGIVPGAAGIIPGMTGIGGPQGSVGIMPQGAAGIVPQAGAAGMVPQGAGMMPAGAAGMVPQGAGMMPAGAAGIVPQAGAAGMMPAGAAGIVPQGAGMPFSTGSAGYIPGHVGIVPGGAGIVPIKMSSKTSTTTITTTTKNGETGATTTTTTEEVTTERTTTKIGGEITGENGKPADPPESATKDESLGKKDPPEDMPNEDLKDPPSSSFAEMKVNSEASDDNTKTTDDSPQAPTPPSSSSTDRSVADTVSSESDDKRHMSGSSESAIMSDAEFMDIMMKAGVPPPSLSADALPSPVSTEEPVSRLIDGSVINKMLGNSSDSSISIENFADFDAANFEGDSSASYLEAPSMAPSMTTNERLLTPSKVDPDYPRPPSIKSNDTLSPTSIVPDAAETFSSSRRHPSLNRSNSSPSRTSGKKYLAAVALMSSKVPSINNNPAEEFPSDKQEKWTASDSSPKVMMRKLQSMQKNDLMGQSPSVNKSKSGPNSSSGVALNATKTLLILLADPNNRSCADCRSPLVDSSKIYASYHVEENDHGKKTRQTVSQPIFKSFTKQHKSVAPSGEVPSEKPTILRPPNSKEMGDPANFAAHRAGGHGVFLCAACSVAHRALGSSLTCIKAVNAGTWTPRELRIMEKSGGNLRSRDVYERYMPQHWVSHRPTGSSTLQEREVFARAKYEALAFLFPCGPLANTAGQHLGGSKSLGDTGLADGVMTTSADTKQGGILPSRLIDYFCVIGPNGKIEKNTARVSKTAIREMSTLKEPEDVRLGTEVIDCFPKQDGHDDMEFPLHLPKFVYPDGCSPRKKHASPSFFTFVLTLENGKRLYGAALHLYDDAVETERLGHMARESGYELIPEWMGDGTSASSKAQKNSEMVFMPKCLVVLSHYRFFDVMRSFLLQLYRISLTEAPLPIERYIANFVSEVPLPPQGKIEVNFALSDELQLSITRPAANRLPLAEFSYRPLFASLSVGNIMVVLGCLLKETRVAICSKHYALLGPVCEALNSLLFPFVWQGMYIPVMPYSMLDVLDAPVPFLVGLHSRYFKDVKAAARPVGIVFVDLDYDIVHLGFEDEDMSGGSLYGRCTPALPEKDAAKLKSKLDESGGIAYVPPEQGSKGRITYGEGQKMSNTDREPYALMSRVWVSSGTKCERSILMEKSDKAFPDNELLQPINGFATEEGTLTEKEVVKSDRFKMKGMRIKKQNSGEPNDVSKDASPRENLLNMDELAGFSTAEIRNAFLRFFASIFKNYEKFLGKSGEEPFRRDAFLDDLKFSSDSRDFVAQVISSQMFERFVEERINSPDQAEVRLFDETIIAKNNRSKKTMLAGGKRKETPFLADQSGLVTDTFVPPPPSNWGLPDDGRSYYYGSFPKLDPQAFGKIRYPKQWCTKEKYRGTSGAALRQQNKIISNYLKPRAPVVPIKSNGSESETPEMNVEWALHAVAYKDSELVSSIASGVDQKKGLLRIGASRKPHGSGAQSNSPLDMIPSAMKLITSARRNQSILLALIIRAQSCCRMYLARTRYKKLFLLQGKTAGVLRAEDPDAEQKLRRFVMSVVSIQRMFRSFKARIVEHKEICAIRLQAQVRREIARRYYRRIQVATLMAQAFVRGRRVRFAFKLVRDLVAKLQAQIRGYFTRKQVSIFREDRVVRYRRQMFVLWKHARTPLTYRSKFWTLISGMGFLHLAIIENELKRLWEALGIVFSSSSEKRDLADSGVLIPGTSALVYQKYLQVQTMIKSTKGRSNKEIVDIFPAEMPSSRRWAQLSRAKERLELERGQIYEKLSSFKDKTKLASIYSALDISPDEKKKKRKFANTVWGSYTKVDQSSAVIFDLFPELAESTNISTVSPSKKAQKQFGSHSDTSVPNHVNDRSFWVQTKIDDAIMADLREITVACFLAMQALMSKGDTRVQSRFSRQLEAIIALHGMENWADYRFVIIRSFLSVNL